MVKTLEHRDSYQPADGGWVSSVSSISDWRMRFADIKPYFAPNKISDLQGPDSGTIQLPLHLYWGPPRWFNLLHRSSLLNAYQMVIEEGTVEDINQYLNHQVLLSIWSDLNLPQRVKHLWEDKVEGLSNVS